MDPAERFGDGGLAIDGLNVGAHYLGNSHGATPRVRCAPGQIDSILLGQRLVNGVGLQLAGDKEANEVRDHQRDDDRIVARHRDEQPATAATVALVPDEPRRAQTRLYKGITTDQYGRFTIKGIAPGGYKLFAWEVVEEGAYQDPDFLKPFEVLGTPFILQDFWGGKGGWPIGFFLRARK